MPGTSPQSSYYAAHTRTGGAPVSPVAGLVTKSHARRLQVGKQASLRCPVLCSCRRCRVSCDGGEAVAAVWGGGCPSDPGALHLRVLWAFCGLCTTEQVVSCVTSMLSKFFILEQIENYVFSMRTQLSALCVSLAERGRPASRRPCRSRACGTASRHRPLVPASVTTKRRTAFFTIFIILFFHSSKNFC